MGDRECIIEQVDIFAGQLMTVACLVVVPIEIIREGMPGAAK